MDTTVKTFPGKVAAESTRLAFQDGELFNFDGVLACYRYSCPDPKEPKLIAVVQVSRIRLASDYVAESVVGAVMRGQSWERAEVYAGNGRYITVDLTGAEVRKIEVPVPKPRDGKTYTWVWVGNDSARGPYRKGAWQREDFPRCPECREYHNPAKSCPE